MTTADITALIHGAAAGDAASGECLFDLIYTDLLRLARSRLARQHARVGLDAHALVHEAWLRLAGRLPPGMASRRVFFGYAARAMETVLIDEFRRRHARKRGAGAVEVTLHTGIEGLAQTYDESHFEALHVALERLERIDPALYEQVQLRAFAGFSIEQAAQLLQSSPATVKRRWRQALTILREELSTLAAA